MIIPSSAKECRAQVEALFYIIMGVCHRRHPNIKIKNMFKNHGINHGKFKTFLKLKF
jgi:hypothetical protein